MSQNNKQLTHVAAVLAGKVALDPRILTHVVMSDLLAQGVITVDTDALAQLFPQPAPRKPKGKKAQRKAKAQAKREARTKSTHTTRAAYVATLGPAENTGRITRHIARHEKGTCTCNGTWKCIAIREGMTS